MTRYEALKAAEEQLAAASIAVERAVRSSVLSTKDGAEIRVDIARGYISLARELDRG